MKKNVYKNILNFLLVLCFIIPVLSAPVITHAATGDSSANTFVYYAETKELYDFTYSAINKAVSNYRSAVGTPDSANVYYVVKIHSGTYSSSEMNIWIYMSDSPFFVYDKNSSQYVYIQSSDGVVYQQRFKTSSDGTSINNATNMVEITSKQTSYTLTAFICSSHNIYDAEGNLYCTGIEEVVEPDPDPGESSLDSVLQGLQHFVSESENINDSVQQQTVVENDNTPNDNTFLNVLQNIAGLNNITNNLLAQFASNTLSLLSDIKNAVSGLAESILPDNLTTMINQFYESGLDSSGNFSIGTMLSYWLIPEKDFVKLKYDELSTSRKGLFQIFSIVETMENKLLTIEPVSPVITIPGGTYGFLTIPDIHLGFEWFEAWRPYTDPFIAACLYIVYIWHLFMSLPGILSGSSATAASVVHFNDVEIKKQNNAALKGGR